MISMSDLKHDAIVNSGIPIHKRYEIPEDLVSSFPAPLSAVSLLATLLYVFTDSYFSFSSSATSDPSRFTRGNRRENRRWLFQYDLRHGPFQDCRQAVGRPTALGYSGRAE